MDFYTLETLLILENLMRKIEENVNGHKKRAPESALV